MTHPKYLFIAIITMLYSCGDSASDITEANTYYIDKSTDSSKKIVTQIDTALDKVWTEFSHAISANNITTFKQLSLDSLYTCDTILSTGDFIKTCYKQVFDTTIAKKIVIPTQINQINVTMELGYFRKYALDNADFKGAIITLKQFQIVKELTPDGAWTMTFDFIKTKNGYRFFGCDSYGGLIYCR